ncbi:DNA ligase D [Pseudomonas ovata]|uniref:DNA ligase D n=1 Tax=Pseudomonas ovata TaxID=1839709 RepID=UPI000D695C79|nr:DNA ligase D [Pseudomonas ovata]
MAKPVSEYTRKRHFDITSEPPESSAPDDRKGKDAALAFVVQKHDARNLHYDFRLELDGTLKSWAVPKGPSLDPTQKRLAVHVEDHPLGYARFEGSIPAGQYGAGDVIVWDRGIWQPHGDPHQAYAAGKLEFTLVGEKLSGDWALVRTRLKGSGSKEQWLLIKARDAMARPAETFDITREQPDSVLGGGSVGVKAVNSAKPASKAKRKPSSKQAGKLVTETPPAFPDSLTPQLATLVDSPPSGEWLYEIKFDGYRIMACVQSGKVRLLSRNGHDWTRRMPALAKALAALKLQDSWLDGEVVVLDDQGLPDFQALQRAFEDGRDQSIVYYLFDAPWLDGHDLRQQPLEARRDALARALAGHEGSLLRFSAAFRSSAAEIIESANALGLEGVIGKHRGSRYTGRRNADWIKLKCRLRQEFVIVGYTAPQGSRSGFGALLLGVYEERALVYAGRVGTGFTAAMLRSLSEQLKRLRRERSPLATPLSGALSRGVQWVEPRLVGEVQFAEWTREGLLRQASFVGLRTDKPATQVVREHPQRLDQQGAHDPDDALDAPVTPVRTAPHKSVIAGVPITHPERVIDPDTETQKHQLAQFYASIADWLLPELARRPVALLRCPEGVQGEQFFQKHAQQMALPHITRLDPALDPGHASLLQIDSLAALIGAVQMGAIEFHTWGATSERIEAPDRLILDLDPDPALPWRSMIEATQMLLAVLDELGLDAFLKTSGGKGMHVIVPLARHAGWDEVKGFAKAIAGFMAGQLPERFSATAGPKNRVGKVFIDYLRNTRGGSTVAAWSVRARPGLPVSVPIAREELAGLVSAAQWHIGNVQARLQSLHQDPWAGYQHRQRITRAMWRQLGATPPVRR